MAIQTVYDEINEVETTFVKGPITAIYVNKLKKDVIGNDPRKGTSWHFTHNINFVIDGERISGGLLQEPKLHMKGKVKGSGDKDYKELLRGMEVRAILEPNGEYKNVKQWKTSASKVLILDDSGAIANDAPAAAGAAPSAPAGKRDNSGISCGHALNCAYRILGYKPKDSEEVVEYAKKLHDITKELQGEVKKANPALSDYELGASVGNAILNACGMLTKTKLGEVKDVAKNILDNESRLILAYVKGEDVPEPKMADAPKATAPADVDPFDEDVPEDFGSSQDIDDPFAD